MSSDDNPVVFGPFRRRIARRRIRAIAARLSREVAQGAGFACLIAGDSELRRLNRTFRGKNYAADVLSFPSAAPPSLGDIAISVDRAAEQARNFGHSVEDEIGVLMLHGLLHLMGMNHETSGGRMPRAERRWRKLMGLPEGLIERAQS